MARRHGLTLLYDASHAFGCTYRARPIGGLGAAEVFSFHATKFVNACEGGAVVTNDNALAAKVRLMKNFGFVHYDQVEHVGTNGKMHEISAAMGLTSLESMDAIIEANYRNYVLYREALRLAPGVHLIPYDERERCNYQYVIAEIDEVEAGISRDDLYRLLHAEKVLARRYFYPGCHRMEPYRSTSAGAGRILAETDRLAGRVLALPTGTAIGHEQILGICQIVQFACRHSAEISANLNRAATVRERFSPHRSLTVAAQIAGVAT